MNPVVTEVIQVARGHARLAEVRRHREHPARRHRALVRKLIVRDADAHHFARRRIEYLELVQVAVEPAHRILDGHVQPPEVVRGRDLDATPDRRLGLLERDGEAQHGVEALGWSAMRRSLQSAFRHVAAVAERGPTV
jgi:hypothetical protein